MRGTEIAYGAMGYLVLVWCYVIFGTEKAYGATRGVSLRIPIKKVLSLSLFPVSYTHLRAHETEADL
eukprot:3148360-Rhodomonas_salina.1